MSSSVDRTAQRCHLQWRRSAGRCHFEKTLVRVAARFVKQRVRRDKRASEETHGPNRQHSSIRCFDAIERWTGLQRLQVSPFPQDSMRVCWSIQDFDGATGNAGECMRSENQLHHILNEPIELTGSALIAEAMRRDQLLKQGDRGDGPTCQALNCLRGDLAQRRLTINADPSNWIPGSRACFTMALHAARSSGGAMSGKSYMRSAKDVACPRHGPFAQEPVKDQLPPPSKRGGVVQSGARLQPMFFAHFLLFST